MTRLSAERQPGGEPGEGPRKVFISYRREGDAAAAGRLYDGLTRQLGADMVFCDVETIAPGSDWLGQIKAELARCGTFLAVVGPNWLSAVQQRDRPPGATPEPDMVVKEIDLALKQGPGLRIIPVLLDGTPMPPEGQLPRPVRPLARHNAVEMRHAHWTADLEHLIDELDSGERQREPSQPPSAEIPAPPPARDGGRITDGRPSPSRQEQATPAPVTAPDARWEERLRSTHWKDVLKRIHRGTLVPILGPGVNAGDRREPWGEGSHSLPNAQELAGALAQHFEIEGQVDLAETAQNVYVKEGPSDLNTTLMQILAPEEYEPTAVHRFLARLPGLLREQETPAPQMIVTANYDTALERAFDECGEEYDVAMYMASGPHAGKFLHIPWEKEPAPIESANEYLDFPFSYDGGSPHGELTRTLIVRIYGAVDGKTGDRDTSDYRWSENYVITEDHYIDYLSGVQAANLVPMQILGKLLHSQCLFLGYPMRAWSLRVFLKRFWEGKAFEPSFAVERKVDAVEEYLWQQYNVELITAELDAYVDALKRHLEPDTVAIES